MSARILLAREAGFQFLVRVHVDEERRLPDGAPDPAYVYEHAVGRDDDRDRAVEEALLRGKHLLECRVLEGAPSPHRAEGKRVDLHRFVSREEAGRKGGLVEGFGTLDVVCAEETPVNVPPGDQPLHRDKRPRDVDHTREGMPGLDDLRGNKGGRKEAPRPADEAPADERGRPPTEDEGHPPTEDEGHPPTEDEEMPAEEEEAPEREDDRADL